MRRNWLAFIECMILGHDDVIRRTPGRLFLRCERCDRETPGWTIATSAQKVDERRRARISRIHPQTGDAPHDRDPDRKNAA
jgi:hypothetical protein